MHVHGLTRPHLKKFKFPQYNQRGNVWIMYIYMHVKWIISIWQFPTVTKLRFICVIYVNVSCFRMSERFNPFPESGWCYMWNQATVREITSCGEGTVPFLAYTKHTNIVLIKALRIRFTTVDDRQENFGHACIRYCRGLGRVSNFESRVKFVIDLGNFASLVVKW
jgi:hypothetical protein